MKTILPHTRKRLRAWIDLLEARHLAFGRAWYRNAHAFALELSKKYAIPLDRTVGVLSVLSVQNRWDNNQRDCEAFLRAHVEDWDLALTKVGTYAIQKKKAIAILQAPEGATIAEMIGTKYAPKTRAFYQNILMPDMSRAVTIDRWMLRGLGFDESQNSGGNQYVSLYRKLVALMQDEADRIGLCPHELQAALWSCIQETAKAEDWNGARPGTGLPEESYDEADLPF